MGYSRAVTELYNHHPLPGRAEQEDSCCMEVINGAEYGLRLMAAKGSPQSIEQPTQVYT